MNPDTLRRDRIVDWLIAAMPGETPPVIASATAILLERGAAVCRDGQLYLDGEIIIAARFVRSTEAAN